MKIFSHISFAAFLMISMPLVLSAETDIFGTLDESISATGSEIINLWPQASVFEFIANDNSVINMFGGQTIAGAVLYYNSEFNMLGGTHGHAIYLHDSSTLNFSGGLIVDHIYAWGTSVVNMSGGILEGWPSIASTFNLTSGDLPDIVYMSETGTLNIFAKHVEIRLGDSNAELTSVGSGSYTKEDFISGIIDKSVSGVYFGSEEHLYFDVTYSDNTTDSFFVIDYPGWSGNVNVHIITSPSSENFGIISEVRNTAEGIVVTFENDLKRQAPNTIVCKSDWSLNGELLAGDTPGVIFDVNSLSIDFTRYKDGAFLQASISQSTAYAVAFDALVYDGTSFGSYQCSGSGLLPPVYRLSHKDQPSGLQLSKSMGISPVESNSPCGQTLDANTRAYVFRVDDPRGIVMDMDVEGSYFSAGAMPRAFTRVLDAEGGTLADTEITVSAFESSSGFGSLNVLKCGTEALRFDLYFQGTWSNPIPIEYLIVYMHSDQDFSVDLAPLFYHPEVEVQTSEAGIGGGYVVEGVNTPPIHQYSWYRNLLYSQWMFLWGYEEDWIDVDPQQGAFLDPNFIVLDLSTFRGGRYAQENDPENPDRAFFFWYDVVVDIGGIRFTYAPIIPVGVGSPNLFDLSGNKIVSPPDLIDNVTESFFEYRPLNFCDQNFGASSFRYSFRALSSGICEVDTSQVFDDTTTNIAVLKFSQSLNANSLFELVVCGQDSVQFSAVADTVYIVAASFEMEISPDWLVELDLQSANPLDSLAYDLGLMSRNEGGGPEDFFPALSIIGIPNTLFQLRVSEDLVNWDEWLEFTISPQGEEILDLRVFEKSPLFLQFNHPVQKN